MSTQELIPKSYIAMMNKDLIKRSYDSFNELRETLRRAVLTLNPEGPKLKDQHVLDIVDRYSFTYFSGTAPTPRWYVYLKEKHVRKKIVRTLSELVRSLGYEEEKDFVHDMKKLGILIEENPPAIFAHTCACGRIAEYQRLTVPRSAYLCTQCVRDKRKV